MNYKAKEILLKAKKDVFSGNLGENITTFKGDGLDFREIREYESGDDVRKINWKATAKSDNLKVNIFNDERELNIVLIFLVSGSINFGTIKLKQDIVSEILALLSYSSLKNNNRLQTLFFSNKNEKFWTPTKNQSIVYDIVQNSLDFDCLKKDIDYDKLCDFINTIIKERSLIFLVGDFYNQVDLSKIAYKNEIYALIVRDRFEEYPIINSVCEFIDPSSFESSDFNLSKDIANEYKKLIEQNDEKLKEHFLQHQISYGKIYTDDDIYLKLVQILKG
jgi:uncharacterized protein (DUF58 family)